MVRPRALMPTTATPVRTMATQKELVARIKSIKNISKITKAMKMVAAAKLRGAQAALDIARSYNQGTDGLFPTTTVKEALEQKADSKIMYVAVTSDKGLCGAINSSIVRSVRDQINALPTQEGVEIITFGNKGMQGLERLFSKRISSSFSELGKKRVQFDAVCLVAEPIVQANFDISVSGYNFFKNMLTYETRSVGMPSLSKVQEDSAKHFEGYEMDGEQELISNLYEFTTANNLYYYFRENEASELSARMNAMGNSSKNADEILEKVTLLYNRTRQAKITTELIEIISGAVALEG